MRSLQRLSLRASGVKRKGGGLTYLHCVAEEQCTFYAYVYNIANLGKDSALEVVKNLSKTTGRHR